MGVTGSAPTPNVPPLEQSAKPNEGVFLRHGCADSAVGRFRSYVYLQLSKNTDYLIDNLCMSILSLDGDEVNKKKTGCGTGPQIGNRGGRRFGAQMKPHIQGMGSGIRRNRRLGGPRFASVLWTLTWVEKHSCGRAFPFLFRDPLLCMRTRFRRCRIHLTHSEGRFVAAEVQRSFVGSRSRASDSAASG
jgi:hypothetical protein